MRFVLVLIVLAIGNMVGYTFWTQPVLAERVRLQTLGRELDDTLADKSGELSRWSRLERLVELGEMNLEPLELARVRDVFLAAERGLPLQRGSLDLRPEDKVPEGFQGIRIRVTQLGDFNALLVYLERLSRIKASLAPVEVSLVENTQSSYPLLLTATWLALWPAESAS